MTSHSSDISIRTAALIAGLQVIVLTAPYGEFYVFGSQVAYKDAALTIHNITGHPQLFLSGIFAMLVTFIYDIVLAWACYIFLRPVNPMLSLLAAWFRLVYTGIAVVALVNFLDAYHIATLPGIDEVYREQQVFHLINTRTLTMDLAYVLFGCYLLILSILIWKASYIPTMIAMPIFLAGLAWILISLRPYFFQEYNFSWMLWFAVGELVFPIWLLIKGTRLKDSEIGRWSFQPPASTLS